MTRSASLESTTQKRGSQVPSRTHREETSEEERDSYLVHRITFFPLAVREMFLAQTGRSGEGAEETGRERDGEEAKDNCVTVE